MPATRADAAAELFQVRPQEFPELVADVRRFSALAGHGATAGSADLDDVHAAGRWSWGPRDREGRSWRARDPIALQVIVREARPPSAMAGQVGAIRDRRWVAGVTGPRPVASPKWRLLIKHPAGSLEAAVESVRRRNLLVSTSILGVLGASMMLMAASMRRSQRLARQQMEFVAAVSHELRTPLAVVRAAGDNLADGVMHDEAQVRKYGELVRSEGRRLTEMVEQILEFAGIHSGQRTPTLGRSASPPML